MIGNYPFSPSSWGMFLLKLTRMISMVGLIFWLPIYAEEGVHEHGGAEMSIAYVKDRLEILIDTPADNILGFEHAPRSRRDKRIVSEKYELLLREVKLGLPELCRPETIGYQGAGFKSTEDLEVAFTPIKDSSEHSDIEIKFVYLCKEKVEKLDFKTWFENFPNFEEIDVEIVTDSKAGFKHITPKDPSVKLP